MMAWLRTGIALIGFGFAIYQFIDKISVAPGLNIEHSYTPKVLGLALIGTGIIALVIGAHWYRVFHQYLWSEEYAGVAGVRDTAIKSPIGAVTLILVLVGVFAFLAVLLRL